MKHTVLKMNPGNSSVLFLCTGNSCRSQMAEGWARHIQSLHLAPSSAGILAAGLDPLAVQVMAELGVDISAQRSKTVSAVWNREFDLVVTVCDHAAASCPVFPAPVPTIHQGFDDPPSLTAEMTHMDDKLAVYRRVRNEIRDFIYTIPDLLNREKENKP